MMLRLNTCCCCVSLRQGAIIIGIFSIICSIIGIIIVTTYGEEEKAYYFKDTNEVRMVGTRYSTPVQVVACILYVGVIIVAAIMIIGVNKTKPTFMVPWLVQNGLAIILQLIYVIILSFSVSSAFIIGALIGTGIAVYLWFAVYSYYKNIKEDYARPVQPIDPAYNV